jgi:hypothetical protein
MPKRHLYWLAAFLSLISLGFFAYKVLVYHYPLTPDVTVKRWNIECKISFIADKGQAIKVALYLPHQDNRFTVLDEGFVARGYGISQKSSKYGKQVVWSTRKANGLQTLYYRVMVKQNDMAQTDNPKKTPIVLRKPLEGATLAAVETVLEQIYQVSADVETQVSELLKRINQAQDESIRFLLGKRPSLIKKLQVIQQVLEQGKITNRIVQGVQLGNNQRQAKPVYWLEVFEQQWYVFDPMSGHQEIPEHYLAWRYGIGPLANVKGGRAPTVETSISLDEADVISMLAWRDKTQPSQLYDFSLLNLPLNNQAVFKILLMIPIGTLLLVIMRNVIGIKMFGTFMPILIALAFRETELVWGIFLFTFIVALGLSIRFYLEQLKLLLVPRLASVLIIVILLIIALSILTHQLNLQHGLSMSLFPIVIITMTIERMSIVWEEHGHVEALQQGFGSLLVAAIAYMIMNLSLLQHLFFVFPELLLLCLVSTLLLGRYTGYRLLELNRFRRLTT